MRERVDGEARNHLVFIREFLRHPRQIQSVIPSSQFLRRRIVQACRAASARLVVELGPGTGATTRALLRAMPPDARLLSVEINPVLHRLVSATGSGSGSSLSRPSDAFPGPGGSRFRVLRR